MINDPTDLGVLRRLPHLDELQSKARDVNRRLLDAERVGQGCVLASPAFERIARPSLMDGRRAPGLRFGDPRVMALAGALAVAANLIGGFSNKTLRPLVAGLLGEPYSQPRCCYDLRRLRLKGLTTRLPRSNTYVLTADGNASRSSTPRSTTGCSGRYSPPTHRRRRSRYGRPYGPSTSTSRTTSSRPG